MLSFVSTKSGDTKHACILFRDGVPYQNATFIEERQDRSPLRRTSRDHSGWRRPLAYTRSVIQAYCQGGQVQGYMSGKRYTFTGEPPNFNLWNNYNFNRILDIYNKPRMDLNELFRANTEVLLKIKDQKVNYGEALAEARETIAHLCHTSRTLLRAFLFARKGKWAKVLRELHLEKKHKFRVGKEASGRWLELQFAWLPLMSDIKSTMGLLQDGFRKNNFRFSATRQIRTELTGDDVMSPVVDNPFNHIVGSGSRILRIKIYAKIRDSETRALAQIGLTDPLQVAWALVPFSFVVDWFLPVGSMLEALDATKGLDFVSGTRTLVVKFQGTAMTQLHPSVVKNQTGWFETSVAVEAMDRVVLTSFPSPALYYKSPFSITHAIDALALLRQLTR